MLRAQIRALRDSREAQQELLATTPMTFRYGSGDLVPGFAQRPTLERRRARRRHFLAGATTLLIVLDHAAALAGGAGADLGSCFRVPWWRLPAARRFPAPSSA